MPDPKAEQIVDAVKDVFEAMTGTYSPDLVVRAPAFHGGLLDETLDCICSISPGPMEETRHAFGTTNNVGIELSIGVALCRRFKGSDDSDQGAGPPQRWDEQLELIRAAGDATRADRQLGGLALDLVIEDIDVSAENTFIKGWAVAFVRLVVSYLHSETSS